MEVYPNIGLGAKSPEFPMSSSQVSPNLSSHQVPPSSHPEVPHQYLLSSKVGTPLNLFQDLIDTFPDGGLGSRIIYQYTSSSYLTDMTRSQAVALSANPIIEYVIINEPILHDGG